MVYIVTSLVLALAWIPLFLRFLRGWKSRKNPVSLAICATISFMIYSNVLTALLVMDPQSWRTARALSTCFSIFIVLNMYVSFHWSNQRFPDARRGSYSVPPTNKTKPPAA